MFHNANKSSLHTKENEKVKELQHSCDARKQVRVLYDNVDENFIIAESATGMMPMNLSTTRF